MRIAEIFRNKGAEVATIAPETSVAELLNGLTEHNIGAMVVVSPGRRWPASSRSAMSCANCTNWSPTCSSVGGGDHDDGGGNVHAR